MNLFGSYYESSLHFMLIMIHVLAALLALVVAPAAMIVRKGGSAHRWWGRAYFWGMFVTNSTALVLLAWRFNIFLLGVTIMSFYSALTGYRVLYRKQATQAVSWFDRGTAWVTLVAGLLLVGYGAATFLGITPGGLPSGGLFVFLVLLPVLFGGMIAQAAFADLRSFRRPSTDRHWWWYYHMERMLGSYIGLLTALMVQQVGPRLPETIAWVVWVLPALLGTLAISYWIGYYQRKFTARAQPASELTAGEWHKGIA